jgi:hypothetical protein
VRAKQPPRLGMLLVERFGPPDDALLGDLAEECRSGRSVLWYWRQVITIVVIGAVGDIRQHWLLALRAIGIGWVAAWVCWEITRPIGRLFSGWVLDQLIFEFGSHPFVMLWATDLSAWPRLIAVYLVSGWVVARLHPRFAGMLIAFVLVTLVTAFYLSLSGTLMRMTIYPDQPIRVFSIVSRTLLPPLFTLIGGYYGLRGRREIRAT